MDGIDVKEFVERHEALGAFGVPSTSLPDLIVAEVERLGFNRIRVVRVGPRPVWSLTACLGQSVYDCDFIVQVAVKRLAHSLGFNLKLDEIIATVRGDHIRAIFSLDDSR